MKIGQAGSSVCPKEGFISLLTKSGRSITMPTTCKTWGCLGCRDRVRNLIKMRIIYGCLKVESSCLITLTFKTEGDSRRDVVSVTKAWTRWLRLMKAKYSEIPWMKIVEATKKGQPHLHVVMGMKKEVEVTCTGKDRFGKPNHRFDWRWLSKECDCLEHNVARYWYEASGDSYVVDARGVVGAFGAAGYLSKYLTKAAMSYETLEKLGFRRRWARSRDWPSGGQLSLVQTSRDGWARTQWVSASAIGPHMRQLWADDRGRSSLAERTGDDFAMLLDRKAVKARGIMSLRRFTHEAIRPEV